MLHHRLTSNPCTLLHPCAAGFGVVHFAECVLKDAGEELKGKRCLVTGSG